MFFKDLITEMTEGMMKAVNKNKFNCPVCHKANLKRNSTVEHYIEVAVVKIASTPVGGSVPAPDYRYKCPKCKAICILKDGKYIPLNKKS